jgi:hypothetical protein
VKTWAADYNFGEIDFLGNIIYDIGGNHLDHGIYVMHKGGRVSNNIVYRVSGFGDLGRPAASPDAAAGDPDPSNQGPGSSVEADAAPSWQLRALHGSCSAVVGARRPAPAVWLILLGLVAAGIRRSRPRRPR